jgi:hypothetical protein
LDTQCNGENEASWQISIKQAAKSAPTFREFHFAGKAGRKFTRPLPVSDVAYRCPSFSGLSFLGYLFSAIFFRLSKILRLK